MAKFILNKKTAISQYNKLKELSDEIVYSFKTNPEVGKVLEENTNCKFAIHTIESLNKIKDKKRVWFFLQAINEEEIKFLIDKVFGFVIDNEADLLVLLNCLKDKKINLALRMKLKEHTIHTGKHFVFGLSSEKINEYIPKLRNKSKQYNYRLQYFQCSHGHFHFKC